MVIVTAKVCGDYEVNVQSLMKMTCVRIMKREEDEKVQGGVGVAKGKTRGALRRLNEVLDETTEEDWDQADHIRFPPLHVPCNNAIVV